MFHKIADNQNPGSLATRMRQKRFGLFRSLLAGLDGEIHILDVGGTQEFWRLAQLPDGKDVKITLLNLEKFPVLLPGIVSVAGDARDIQFADAHFDVVFSNSVIEHVGDLADQERMAREVRRVGKRHFIQTPNKYFPIEPHFVFPMYQFLPGAVQIWLLQNFKLGWMAKTPDREQARAEIAGIRLLNKREFKNLFPTSIIFEEKFFGLTKSFIAYGGWQ